MHRAVTFSLLGFLFLSTASAQRVITTFAGTDWLFSGDGGPAKNAPISGEGGLDVAVDSSGNYYICDQNNYMVFKVTPDGIIHNFAGNGFGQSFASGDGGLAVNAALFIPFAVAVDPSGNVFITEYDQRIRKVTPDGIITTYVGTGEPGFSGDGGPASKATINYASGLATDSAGNLYIADTGNNRIRKVTPDGIITTVAGTGKLGSVGNNVPALSAQLYAPVKLAVDPKGNVYVVETLNINVVSVVRKIDTNGIISSVAGGGLDPSDGVAATTAALLPLAVSTDQAGNLYIVDYHLGTIREVTSDGLIHTVAGSSPDAGFSGRRRSCVEGRTSLLGPYWLAIDKTGDIYLADDGNNRIREITPDGTINTLAGNGLFRFSGNGGPAADATLNDPVGLLGDSSGNLYIAEGEAGRIRKVAPDGTITVIAGNHGNTYAGDGGPAIFASLGFPTYMTFAPDGSLVFSDLTSCVVRAISPAGIISTIAGNNICTYAGDGGPATKASLAGPSGVAYDSVGDLIISDTYNHRIRVVFASSGDIFTIAGDGTQNFSGDGASSLKAQINTPEGVRVYNGATYFADSGNNRIRKIDNATLTISTVAGNGMNAYAGDGGKATAASLSLPLSVNFDSAGNLYIADTDNSVVRKVDANGIISTFAGEDPFDTLNDGGLATMAAIGGPQDVYIDPAGDFFISDIYFARVRELPLLRPSFQVSTANLAFTAQAGSTPLSQRIDVTGGIAGIPFTVASSASWLTASLTSGNMPSGMDITADPSGLTAGSYQGTITITAPTTATVSVFVRVAFTVTAAGQPSLSAKPSTLTFSAVINAPAATRTIAVSNLGGGTIAYSAATTTSSGGSWLTVSSSSGTVGAFGSQSLVATLNPAGLSAGTYSGTVIISSGTSSTGSPAQSVTLPVTMTISQVEQTLLIPQSGLTFYAVSGGGAPPPQFLSILNTGRGQMPFTTSVSTVTGGAWLAAFPGSGTSDAASTVIPTVRIDVDPSSLQTGIYYGTVQVLAPTAANNPQFVSVVLNVLPPGSNIGPIVQPTGLIFTAQEGTLPGSRTVLVQNTSSTPLTFHSGITTVDGGAWLGLLPGDGTVTKAQPVPIVIQPETDGLGTGVYRGSIALSFSDGSVRVIAVVLVVTPGPGSSQSISQSHPRATRDGNGCLPSTLVPVFTLLSSGFSATAGFPGQVAVQVVDDCGTAMTTGDVIASFSSGDPPLRLTSLKDGNWVGTWTPQRVVSPITVTADAAIADQNLKGEVALTGSLQATGATPIFGSGGVVNGASFLSTLSPGSFVTLFGSNLALNTQLAPTVPLPTVLGGSTIYVAGNQIPVYYASNGQVNAILPYGLAVNTTQQVLVSTGSSLSVPQSITVAAAAPGIFATTGNQGIIQGVDSNGNVTLADTGHPVTAGQTIVIYCTGLGEVTPSIAAGTQTPASPLSTTVNPVTVTIGGINAPVAFAGLTPLQTGLYQVNAVVPAGVAPGNQVPVVVTAAGQGSAPVTIAIR